MDMKNKDMKGFKAQPSAGNIAICMLLLIAILASKAFWPVDFEPVTETEDYLQLAGYQETQDIDSNSLVICGKDNILLILNDDRTLLIEGATCK